MYNQGIVPEYLKGYSYLQDRYLPFISPPIYGTITSCPAKYNGDTAGLKTTGSLNTLATVCETTGPGMIGSGVKPLFG